MRYSSYIIRTVAWFLAIFIGIYFFTYLISPQFLEITVESAMKSRAKELISNIQSAKDDKELIQRLKDQKSNIFFRVGVITDQRKLLYDTHIKRLLKTEFVEGFPVMHPEVEDAFEFGEGDVEGYSEQLDQEFFYYAKRFDFHGKPYVLRTAFPHFKVMSDALNNQILRFGIVLYIVALLAAFIAVFFVIWPITKIISAIKLYQKSPPEVAQLKLPQNVLDRTDELGELARKLADLTEQVRTQFLRITQERNEKETLLESLVEGVVAVDSDMTIIYVNQAALKLLSFEGENLIGERFSIVNQHKCYTLLTNCQKERKLLTDTLVLKKPSGNVYLDLVAVPIKETRGAVLVMQDRTSQYKMIEMRKEFVANASHELKSPITVLQGFAETLHDNPDLPEATLKEVTGKIMKTSQGMTTLINDLLTLADIEHIPEHRLVPCDLVSLLENSSQRIHEAFPDAKIEINKDPKEIYEIHADPSLIRQAFINLIKNGVKYSEPPSEITIDVKKSKDQMEIAITDRGIGIPEADLSRIFDRFYTVNKAESKKRGGSGLGLSIVQTIVNKHSGKISVASTLGQGTTFTVTLPINPLS